MTYKVTSIRYGFATNSSSSHSIITGVPSWKNKSKQEIVDMVDFTDYDYISFGECAEIDEVKDIMLYALYAFIVDPNTSYNNRFETVEKFEFFCLSKGFSDEFNQFILKLNDKILSSLIVSDDNNSAGDYKENIGLEGEDVFWHFVYNVSYIEDSY